MPFWDVERELSLLIFEQPFLLQQIGLRCLSCRQLLRQCLDAFALGLRRLSLKAGAYFSDKATRCNFPPAAEKDSRACKVILGTSGFQPAALHNG